MTRNSICHIALQSTEFPPLCYIQHKPVKWMTATRSNYNLNHWSRTKSFRNSYMIKLVWKYFLQLVVFPVSVNAIVCSGQRSLENLVENSSPLVVKEEVHIKALNIKWKEVPSNFSSLQPYSIIIQSTFSLFLLI